MIDRKQLLDDLQDLLRKHVEPDLRERSELPEIAAALTEEFETAKKAERTALNYTDWRSDYITQIGVGWVLSCVFIRFLEDNDLIDPPKLSGPAQTDGDSQASQSGLNRARDEYDLYIKANPTHSFREYILSVVDQLAKLPGVSDIFGDKNVIHQQRDWLSNDAAKVLYNFWQTIEPETGRLIHNFVDDTDTETFDTRFLGDLYQDLSERARKKYALLQTPDFVEEFILDRTLEPALDEFGLQPGTAGESEGASAERDRYIKMIDPACGSGHFLLGAFPRILRRWQQKEPGTKVDVLVQRTLYSIHGVDINPFAIAIARFRLLLASLRACGIERLKNAIDFDLSNLACGDSLYHGRQKQKTLGDWTDESHYFQTEDADNLKHILQEGTFHAVVANPPYITPKDDAANQAYRQLYPVVCHKEYSLAAPFMQRLMSFSVSLSKLASGFVGQITANSFMTNEFGKPLVEKYLVDTKLTHIIDTRYLTFEGHGTPTVILFARNCKPSNSTVRTVMGIKGATGDNADSVVWSEILGLVDTAGSDGDFVSTVDRSRESLSSHPWSIGGGGLSELKTHLDSSGTRKFRSVTKDIGYTCITKEDEFFVQPKGALRRRRAEERHIKPFGIGQEIRDWREETQSEWVVFPYQGAELSTVSLQAIPRISESLWPYRSKLRDRKVFDGQTYLEAGKPWHEYGQIPIDRFHKQKAIVFAYKATHNHYVYNRSGKLFSRPAPVIKFNDETSEAEQLAYLALFNSSTTAFWEGEVHRQVSGEGLERWQVRLERNCTKLKDFPLPSKLPTLSGKELDELASEWHSHEPQAVVERGVICIGSSLADSREPWIRVFTKMILRQESLDWECYKLYGLIDEDLTYLTNEARSFGIQLGERAFEIVMARKMAAGELQTTWFERHSSTPITEIPDHWPDDYKQLVQRRIEVIESNKNIALIEQPEYKRRWNTEPWDSQVERALKSWLLDRLESYFDFDGRMGEPQDDSAGSSETPPLADIQLVSVAKLADVAAKDSQFIEVANVYRDREDFDIVKLVDELVSEEHVPALPILRYKPSGLDKRAAWVETWELQRSEDAIEARIRKQLDGLLKMGGKNKDKEGTFRKDLPDDSPLLEFFSQVQVETNEEGEEEKTSSQDNFLTVDEIVRRVVKQEMGEIPVPPKYASKDMISTGGAKYWKLRGKLDVPKERWVSFPNTEGEDQTLVIAWAGYDHLQLLRAIAAYFADVQQRGGSDDPRLVPLLAAMDQQIPWVKQWHNEIDPDVNRGLGDWFADFIDDEARTLGITVEKVRQWEPPKKVKKRAKKKATKKKSKVGEQ